MGTYQESPAAMSRRLCQPEALTQVVLRLTLSGSHALRRQLLKPSDSQCEVRASEECTVVSSAYDNVVSILLHCRYESLVDRNDSLTSYICSCMEYLAGESRQHDRPIKLCLILLQGPLANVHAHAVRILQLLQPFAALCALPDTGVWCGRC